MSIDPLLAIVKRLHPAQVELLLEMARAMMRHVEETLNPASDIAVEAFRVSFRNRLLLHHAANESKLTKKAFEYAFRAASAAAGRSAAIVDSQTNPGADVIVDGEDFSLKTEAAKSLRPGFITISKLSEGRWIQQCSSMEELAQATVTRIPAHLLQYDRILTLRARDLSATRVLYELVEIPRSVLLNIQNLKPGDFSPRTAQGGSSAGINISGQRAFTLRLDGSDGKVTISGLDVRLCFHHCSWSVPTVAPAAEDESEAAPTPSPAA